MTVAAVPARVGIMQYCPPKEGSAAYPLTLDFTNTDTWELNLQNMQANGALSQLEALWVDNADNTDDLQILVSGTGQRIIIPAGSQGYVNLLAPNPPAIAVRTTQAAITVQLILCNTVQMPIIWNIP